MLERNTIEIAHRTTTQDITWFTPSVGVTSTELCFIQSFYKNHSSDLRTQLQIPSVLKAAHTAAGLYAHSCRFPYHPKPSAHTAAEVVHAHSWDLTFSYKISLSFASIPFTQKS